MPTDSPCVLFDLLKQLRCRPACTAAPLQLHEFRPDAFAAPAFEAGRAEMPARGQLFLVEMNDFHFGLLPNELAGVHEGAVPPSSQGNS